jgi:hypothetical protein
VKSPDARWKQSALRSCGALIAIALAAAIVPAFGQGAAAATPVTGIEFLGWTKRGALHILRGYDHLAFLLALLLVGGTWRRVLVLITSFTVAHSLTLGAGALGWIRLDEPRQRWAEAAIAVTIVLVATENLLAVRHPYRVAATFVFGLVHGLGFATALRDYGLGASPVLSLVGFNLGVELGQASLVVMLFPLLQAVRRRARTYAWVVRVGSTAILCAGAYWLVLRLSVVHPVEVHEPYVGRRGFD